MSQISNVSKIRDLIYRLDIYNLQTKIESFSDQEKLLKEIVFSHVVSMNANTKASQKNTVYVQSILWSKSSTCTIYRPEKTSKKWPRVKIYILTYPTIKILYTVQKSSMVRIKMYNLQNKQAKNVFNCWNRFSFKLKHVMRPNLYIILKLLDMSKICFVIYGHSTNTSYWPTKCS